MLQFKPLKVFWWFNDLYCSHLILKWFWINPVSSADFWYMKWKIRTIEVFKFEYIISFHNALLHWAFLLTSMLCKDFCLTGSWLFCFPRIIKLSCLRKSCSVFLTECAYFVHFFLTESFPFPPLSVQEMLTGQRLCQSSSHNDAVLAALNQQRSDGILCDITLIAEEQKFHAHKAVLAACSDYFRVSLQIFLFI